jgi:hypothetical protein
MAGIFEWPTTTKRQALKTVRSKLSSIRLKIPAGGCSSAPIGMVGMGSGKKLSPTGRLSIGSGFQPLIIRWS